ncbi:cytochrome P450 [Xylariomycetidae sp. FL0641]|nr:cytochrome P450 [Xylariomycetidae sp. FL0641]
MEANDFWRMLVISVIAYYAALAFRRSYLHPLSRFPGPKLAAISRWYEAYYDVVLGGKYTSRIAELHKTYGPIIRISPFELHVIDPSFFDTLYRMDGRWDKYTWTYDAFGAPGSTVFGSDHDAHEAHRRAIAPFFSKMIVASRGYLIRRNANKLCWRIFQLVGTTFNLGAAISAYTRDNVNEFVVGKAYNELDLEDFGVGLTVASQDAGVLWRATKHIRWFGPVVRAIPVGWIMKTASEGTKAFLRYLQLYERHTRDTLAAAKTSSSEFDGQTTVIHEIVHSNLPPAEKTPDRIVEEVATVTAAGYETTANTLRLILYHVYTRPDILQRLRDELPTRSATASKPLAVKELEQLPYLTAVLKEGLRLSPGVATRAARVTNTDLVYDGRRIPAGTPVGMTVLLMHTDERLYPDPMRFDPDRWSEPGPKGAAADPVFAPFSRGTRACLGMHLAWAEMYLLLAALVPRFDFAIDGAAAAGDFELERDDFGIGTKAGCNVFASVTERT